MDRKEMVKQIREQLKKKGITSRQVSITSKASLYDDVINATIKDLKVSFNTVEEIVKQYSHVTYDECNGEILAGCNVYTNVKFDYDAMLKERENYLELAKELMEKYKNLPDGNLEIIARKGDLEVLYMPNSNYGHNPTIEVCKIIKQEYSSNYGEFYNSINELERYNAHNEFSIAEAMVYITNQYEINFFEPIPELDESILEVHCIPQEEKDRQKRAEEENKKFEILAQQVKNIQPLKVENIKDKNIKINAIYPSLNKRNTIEEYEKQLAGDCNINKTLICEIITLSNVDYKLFTNNLLCDCNMIAGKGGNGSDYKTEKESFLELTEAERKEYKKQSYILGILVQDENRKNQIVVDPQGYNYARYVGILKEPFKHI